MHRIFSFLTLKNVELDVRPSFEKKKKKKKALLGLSSVFFIELIGAINANMCSFVSPPSLYLSHALPSAFSLFHSVSSCTLSVFGVALSYTILHQATQPPFLASSSSHFLLARVPTLSTPFSFTSKRDPSPSTS